MNTTHKFKILILGQCISIGEGIRKESSYPQLVKQMLGLRFPMLSFQVEILPLLHPTGLKALIKSCLQLRPDVVLLSLPAIFASIPYRVNHLYLQAPDIMRTARKFISMVESRIRGDLTLATLFSKRHALRMTSVIGPLSIAEYERLIEDAMLYCRTASNCRVVLLGPGGFNEDTKIDDLESPEFCGEVNQMILRVAKKLNVAVINAHELTTDLGGKVFQFGNHRWNQQGHEIVAREIGSVLASQIQHLPDAAPECRRSGV
jgi:hypothetical protein